MVVTVGADSAGVDLVAVAVVAADLAGSAAEALEAAEQGEAGKGSFLLTANSWYLRRQTI